jgi:hypothetical protein
MSDNERNRKDPEVGVAPGSPGEETVKRRYDRRSFVKNLGGKALALGGLTLFGSTLFSPKQAMASCECTPSNVCVSVLPGPC